MTIHYDICKDYETKNYCLVQTKAVGFHLTQQLILEHPSQDVILKAYGFLAFRDWGKNG